MAIKMRVNENTLSICEECKTKYHNVEVMYDLFIVDTKFTLCHDCCDKVFRKILKAQCLWNGKIKDKQDMERINRVRMRKTPRPTVEKKEEPNCYGTFLKQQKCKKCEFNKDCKEVWQNSGWED